MPRKPKTPAPPKPKEKKPRPVNPAPRKSRVRGASKPVERADWPFEMTQTEWRDRLNFVRQTMTDRKVAELTGVSTNDPTFKTVRRWDAGLRNPSRKVYETIIAKYDELKALLGELKLVEVAPMIRRGILGEVKNRFLNKVNVFLHSIKPNHIYQREEPVGMTPDPEAAARMQIPTYISVCDNLGFAQADGKEFVVLIVMTVLDEGGTHTETALIQMIDHPSLTLGQNQIDTWIKGLPQNLSYKHFLIYGVWYSYIH